MRNLSGHISTGSQRYHEKLLRTLNPDRNIKNSYLAIEDMMDYDLTNLQAEVNTEALAELKFLQSDSENYFLEDLAQFSNWFIDSAPLREKIQRFSTSQNEADTEFADTPVSYTHLTLPTICSV